MFANLLLADEINRAPSKVQSALLEAMEERQVTLGEDSFPLPDPFLVLATQNPLEQEGTFPLPEAQMDRFLFKLKVDYPSAQEEGEVLRRAGGQEEPVLPVMTGAEILEAGRRAREVRLDEAIRAYIVRLVQATRPGPGAAWKGREMLRCGASPRASLALQAAAKALAFLQGRDHVLPDDVAALAPDVLRHRLLLTFESEADGATTDELIRRPAARPCPGLEPHGTKRTVTLIHTGGTLGMAPGGRTPRPWPRARPWTGSSSRCRNWSSWRTCAWRWRSTGTPAPWSPEHILTLARLAREAAADSDGVVLVHGTDTMAYTASVLGFLLADLGKPVVLTGSQRPLAYVRSDARSNLVDAVTLATRGVAEVGICFGDHWLRGVAADKVSVHQYEAFEIPQPAAPGGAGPAHPAPPPRRRLPPPGARRRWPRPAWSRPGGVHAPSRACPGACPPRPPGACWSRASAPATCPWTGRTCGPCWATAGTGACRWWSPPSAPRRGGPGHLRTGLHGPGPGGRLRGPAHPLGGPGQAGPVPGRRRRSADVRESLRRLLGRGAGLA